MKPIKMKHVTTKTVLLVVLSSIVLGLASLFIGLSIFRDSLLQGSISRACTTTARTAAAAAHGADIEGLARDVMSVYESLTPEQRSMTGTEEYRQFFRSLDSVGKTGGAHDILVNMLRNYTIDVARIYICAFDAERNAVICLADTDPDNPAYPGEWKPAAGNLIEELTSLTDYDWNGGNTPYEFTATESEGKVCLAGYPILNENHEKCAYLLTEHYLNDVFAQTNQYALKIVEVVLVVTLLIAFLVGLRMKKTVADPINAIADTATVYVQDRKNGIDRSDHFSSLNIHTGDELENLTNVMADMEQDLIEHEETVTRITAEKERVTAELNMAAQIQTSILPRVFPPFPDRTEFELYASMTPALDVGGDFYDFFLIDDDHLALVIADVSGKGIPAALFMMASKVILKNNAMLGKSVGEILERTNDLICAGNSTGMFVTVWMGILEISTGKIKAANAGHEYPAILHDGSFELFKDRHGFVIGGMEKTRYREYELQLEKGGKLFVYTDGVPEATDENGELFGTERMVRALNNCADSSPQEILTGVKDAVDSFVGNAKQFDDLTMLCLAYKG